MINKFANKVIQDIECYETIRKHNFANSVYNETTFYSWKGLYRK